MKKRFVAGLLLALIAGNTITAQTTPPTSAGGAANPVSGTQARRQRPVEQADPNAPISKYS